VAVKQTSVFKDALSWIFIKNRYVGNALKEIISASLCFVSNCGFFCYEPLLISNFFSSNSVLLHNPCGDDPDDSWWRENTKYWMMEMMMEKFRWWGCWEGDYTLLATPIIASLEEGRLVLPPRIECIEVKNRRISFILHASWSAPESYMLGYLPASSLAAHLQLSPVWDSDLVDSYLVSKGAKDVGVTPSRLLSTLVLPW
jgi:hypothetical protein